MENIQRSPRRPTAAEKRKYNTNYENLLTRKISEGRRVDRESFPPEVIQPFRDLDWTSFLDLSGPIYENLVRQFYASYSFNTRTNLVSCCLDDRVYEMSLDVFGTYLAIPTEGARFHSTESHLNHLPEFLDTVTVKNLICNDPQSAGSTLSGVELKPPHNLRYKIIDWNVYCREGNHDSVTASIATLLYCLDQKVKVNLTYFVATRMNGLITNKRRSLPYAMLLNNIFESLPLDRTIYRHPQHTFLDSSTISKMGRQSSLGRLLSKRSKSKRSREYTEEEEEIEIYVGEPSESGAAQTESPEEELEAEDPEDPFYTMSPAQQMSMVYRQQRSIRKEQQGIKKMLRDILNVITCNRNPSSSTRD